MLFHSPHPEICLLLQIFFCVKLSLYFIPYIWNCVRCVFSGYLAQYRQPLFSLSLSPSSFSLFPNPFSPFIPPSRYYSISARNSVTSMMKWQNKQNPGEQEIIGQWKNASSLFALRIRPLLVISLTTLYSGTEFIFVIVVCCLCPLYTRCKLIVNIESYFGECYEQKYEGSNMGAGEAEAEVLSWPSTSITIKIYQQNNVINNAYNRRMQSAFCLYAVQKSRFCRHRRWIETVRVALHTD